MSVYPFRASPTSKNKINVTSLTNNETFAERLSGKGLGLKPAFRNNQWVTVKGLSKILQSIFIILSTPIGSRFFNPNFGSRLYECLHEPNDFIFKDMVELYISQALAEWEKRISAKVTCTPLAGSNRADILIEFSLIGDTTIYSYTYPVSRELSTII